jgi:integrase
MAIRTYIEKGKKLYEVYINGADARGIRVQRKRKGIETLRRAETAEFELMRELAQIREEKIPFRWSEWYNECIKRMKVIHRPSTIWSYDKVVGHWINPLWGQLEIQTISRTEVHSTIFEKIGPRFSPSSRKTALKLVRRIFEMAVEEGIIDRNPCSGIRVHVPEVEQKVLTTSEVDIFLREAKLTRHRFYPVWAFALMTGMRSGEMFALRWTDIDLDARIISVSRQWTSRNGYCPTKTQKSRVVPVSEDLLKFLKELKLKHGAEREFVLPRFTEWENGEQAKITREFCTAIGITAIKFHDLRATFITNLLARGESLARVMAIVGHSQLKTTNGYLRRAGVDVQGGTEKLGYKLPGESSGAQILTLVRSTK